MLADGVTWLDDWFCHQDVAPGIHAIGEPRFHQINWNYLVTGKDRALMFDSGTGVRDIRPIIRRLTQLPVTCLPSHMHFDHTGNLHLFDDVAIVDLPLLRAFERGGMLLEPIERYLGAKEGMRWTAMRVHQWWPVGQRIDLGGRVLEIVHTPGHAPEHIALWDGQAQVLLAADFIYLGALYGQVPGANIRDYARAANDLLSMLPATVKIFGAHGMPDEDGNHRAPELDISDLETLSTILNSLQKTGFEKGRVDVNSRMYLLINEAAFG